MAENNKYKWGFWGIVIAALIGGSFKFLGDVYKTSYSKSEQKVVLPTNSENDSKTVETNHGDDNSKTIMNSTGDNSPNTLTNNNSVNLGK